MKKLMILICLLVTSFSMFACVGEQKEQLEKILGNRSENAGETAKGSEGTKGTENTGETAKGTENTKDNPSEDALSEVGKYLRAKGCDDNEIRAMQQMEKETYGPTLHPLNFTGGHFNYADCEGQTHANCGLYADKRLLHHMGQLGYVSDDLWYRYSDEELRNFIVLATRNHEPYRNQNETLTFEAVVRLLIHLGLNNEQLNLITFKGRDTWDCRALIYDITHGIRKPWVEPLYI